MSHFDFIKLLVPATEAWSPALWNLHHRFMAEWPHQPQPRRRFFAEVAVLATAVHAMSYTMPEKSFPAALFKSQHAPSSQPVHTRRCLVTPLHVSCTWWCLSNLPTYSHSLYLRRVAWTSPNILFLRKESSWYPSPLSSSRTCSIFWFDFVLILPQVHCLQILF